VHRRGVLTNISPKGKTMSTFIGYSSNIVTCAKLSENGQFVRKGIVPTLKLN
jgi:hypothetical protein